MPRLAANAVTVVAGTTTLNSGGVRYTSNRIVNHAGYNTATFENDISLVRVSSTIGGPNIATIPISSGAVGGGISVVLSGWGRTTVNGAFSNDLQYLNLFTLSDSECSSRLSQMQIFASNLCTFTRTGQGACTGDSGGPLVASNVLVGVVSWGLPCAIGFPDVYARVSSYVGWIQSNAT